MIVAFCIILCIFVLLKVQKVNKATLEDLSSLHEKQNKPINNKNMGTNVIPVVDIKDMAIYTGLSLIAKGMSVSPLKLQKILYYEQAWFMVFYGRGNTLFDEVPQAWVNGPVYPSIYQQYRCKVPNMCDHLSQEHFTMSDIQQTIKDIVSKAGWNTETVELLDSIITLYGSKTQNQLIFLTHAEAPWVEARCDMPPYMSSTNPISLDTMYGYYKARRERKKASQ